MKGWGHEAPPYLSLIDIERLIGAIDKEECRLIVRLLAYTGARVSEILALKAEDVNLMTGELKLPALKSKTEKFKFVVIHDPIALIILRQEVAKHKKGKLFDYSKQRIWQIIRRAGEKIGIKGLHPATLRDSFAYNWIKSGGDLIKLQRQLGHSSYAITADRYLKYQTSDIKEEGKKLTQAILQARKKAEGNRGAVGFGNPNAEGTLE